MRGRGKRQLQLAFFKNRNQNGTKQKVPTYLYLIYSWKYVMIVARRNWRKRAITFINFLKKKKKKLRQKIQTLIKTADNFLSENKFL